MSGGIVVVKLGGTTLADQRQVLAEVAGVARERPIILVHGGGKRMTEWLERLGVQTRVEGGGRVTHPPPPGGAGPGLGGGGNSEAVPPPPGEGGGAGGPFRGAGGALP